MLTFSRSFQSTQQGIVFLNLKDLRDAYWNFRIMGALSLFHLTFYLISSRLRFQILLEALKLAILELCFKAQAGSPVILVKSQAWKCQAWMKSPVCNAVKGVGRDKDGELSTGTQPVNVWAQSGRWGVSGGGEEVGTRGAGSISSGGASEAVAAERQDQDRFKKREKRSL